MNVYTDGSCLGNPGKGGWGFISIDNNTEFHIAGNEHNTTNNRMELLAVIQALMFHKNVREFNIFSDSTYVINCASGKWKRTKNTDLWEQFKKQLGDRKINWIKVKAHSGNKYNELVDKLAKEYAEI